MYLEHQANGSNECKPVMQSQRYILVSRVPTTAVQSCQQDFLPSMVFGAVLLAKYEFPMVCLVSLPCFQICNCTRPKCVQNDLASCISVAKGRLMLFITS